MAVAGAGNLAPCTSISEPTFECVPRAGRRESGEHNGPAAPSQDQQQDQQQQHRIEPERQINTAQPPSPKQPVHMPTNDLTVCMLNNECLAILDSHYTE